MPTPNNEEPNSKKTSSKKKKGAKLLPGGASKFFNKETAQKIETYTKDLEDLLNDRELNDSPTSKSETSNPYQKDTEPDVLEISKKQRLEELEHGEGAPESNQDDHIRSFEDLISTPPFAETKKKEKKLLKAVSVDSQSSEDTQEIDPIDELDYDFPGEDDEHQFPKPKKLSSEFQNPTDVAKAVTPTSNFSQSPKPSSTYSSPKSTNPSPITSTKPSPSHLPSPNGSTSKQILSSPVVSTPKSSSTPSPKFSHQGTYPIVDNRNFKNDNNNNNDNNHKNNNSNNNNYDNNNNYPTTSNKKEFNHMFPGHSSWERRQTVANDEMRLTIVNPTDACLYCGAFGVPLMPFSSSGALPADFMQSHQLLFSDPTILCGDCNSVLVHNWAKSRLLPLNEVQIMISKKQRSLNRIELEELKASLNQLGPLCFWDKSENGFQVVQKNFQRYDHRIWGEWCNEWIKHLIKQHVHVWSMVPSLLLYAPFNSRDILQALAEFLCIPFKDLKEYTTLLQDNPQLIFFGPPGTGKTFIIKEIAKYITQATGNRKGDYTLVQFHPNYTYEDFIQGIKPRHNPETNSVYFENVKGPLLQLAERANHDRSNNYVLIIDELNRANTATVFGEFYYLLEYRDETLTMQSSSEKFSLPPNFFILASMNASDRSLTVLDRALRRRFNFVPFFPDQPPIKDVLKTWTEKNNPGMMYIIDVIERGNAILRKYDDSLWIPLSSFLKPGLTSEQFERKWKYSVVADNSEVIRDSAELKRFKELPAVVKREYGKVD